MKKNGNIVSIMLRNNNYLNNTKNINNKLNDLEKIKNEISTASNIIKKYKKFTNNKFSGLKLNKVNSFKKNKKSFKSEILPINNNIFYKKKNNFDAFNDYIKNQNILNNQHSIPKNNIIYEDDTVNSSMETIKNILYNTDINNEPKENELNNVLKSTQVDNLKNLKLMFDKNDKNNKKREAKKSSLEINTNRNNNINGHQNKINIESENKIIDKRLLNKINRELTIHTNREVLKSMKFLKTNNYDFDNMDNNLENSLNISDEFKTIIEEKDGLNSKNNINNFSISNINKDNIDNINNINNKEINNNSNNSKKNNNKKINKIKKKINQNRNGNYTNRLEKIDNIFEKNNNTDNNNNEIFYLKEKIKELTEEINNKNILINEYSNLAKKSKIKFEQLIIQNKKNIELIQKETKNQIILYKSKIINMEKEKQSIINKYLENKKYTEFLEKLLINHTDNENNYDENNKIKNLEEIVKKLMNDTILLKSELEDKIKENKKLKNIIIQYKDNKSYRAISNPRKNININEQIKNLQKSVNNIKKRIIS